MNRLALHKHLIGWAVLAWIFQAGIHYAAKAENAASPSQSAPPAAGPAPATTSPNPSALDPMTARKVLDSYITGLKTKIMHTWLPPTGRKAGNPIVSFSVQQDGSLLSAEVSTSSGDPELDASAVRTIKRLAPFAPLPPEAPNNLIIDFTFDYVALGHAANDPEDRVEQKKKAAEADPKNSQATFDYGIALRFAGNKEEAITQFKRAIDLGFQGEKPYLEMAKVYKELGKAADSEAILRDVLKKQPDLASAHGLLADLFFKQKRWADAELEYKEVLRIDPHGQLSHLAGLRLETCRREANRNAEPEE